MKKKKIKRINVSGMLIKVDQTSTSMELKLQEYVHIIHISQILSILSTNNKRLESAVSYCIKINVDISANNAW